MKKILAAVLGLGVVAAASGCAATNEDLGSVDGAFTRVDNGVCATHVQIAAEIVRTAMVDLGRYRPGLDLVKDNGRVVLTAGGQARCTTRGGCPRLKSLLSYQYLTNMQTDALAPEFPWMQNLQTGNISNAIAATMSDALNPNPNAVMTHDFTFDHVSPATQIANCGADLKYHCFSVSGLPAGKTVDDLVTNLRQIFSSTSDFAAVTRVFNENGFFCIDPDGTGDDQTGGGSTGGSTCVDGTMAMSYDANYVGNCCTLSNGTGFLVQNTIDPNYMSCKVTNLADLKPATSSTALANNPASNTTDADLNSLWIASTTAANEWVKVDLGTSQNVKGVVFKFESPGAYGYKVETSANGSIWAVKKTGTSVATAASQDANFAQVSARYVRVTLTSLPAGRSAAFSSVRVYN